MHESASIGLDVHGVSIRVSGEDGDALREIVAQFLGFQSSKTGRDDIRIELRSKEDMPAFGGRLVADQIVERGIVYNRGNTIFVDHHDRSASFYDYGAERGIVYARETADFVELCYLMIHSRLGPLLEARGLTRIHACGFVVRGKAGLVLAPSGGGKSRLALALLEVSPEVRLLGDDMVLLDRRGSALPFPHPIGVSDPHLSELFRDVRRFSRRSHEDKWLIGGDEVLRRHAVGAFPVALIALLRRASAPPTRAVPAGRAAVAGALWRDAVVGLGLPQVLEMVARRGARDLLGLAPSVVRRGRRAVRVARAARAISLEVHDPREAAGLLVEQLD